VNCIWATSCQPALFSELSLALFLPVCNSPLTHLISVYRKHLEKFQYKLKKMEPVNLRRAQYYFKKKD